MLRDILPLIGGFILTQIHYLLITSSSAKYFCTSCAPLRPRGPLCVSLVPLEASSDVKEARNFSLILLQEKTTLTAAEMWNWEIPQLFSEIYQMILDFRPSFNQLPKLLNLVFIFSNTTR